VRKSQVAFACHSCSRIACRVESQVASQNVANIAQVAVKSHVKYYVYEVKVLHVQPYMGRINVLGLWENLPHLEHIQSYLKIALYEFVSSPKSRKYSSTEHYLWAPKVMGRQ
jgi:hypothetical protein